MSNSTKSKVKADAESATESTPRGQYMSVLEKTREDLVSWRDELQDAIDLIDGCFDDLEAESDFCDDNGDYIPEPTFKGGH